MRVTPIQKSVFSNRQRSQTWPRKSSDSHDSPELQKDGFEKSSDNSALEKGLTYDKLSVNMSSNNEKERKNDYSDPEKF
tara:strand:+ start:1610 stop:1846 length:237 start_codon:yes stop_codon:yes gene_type:complete